MSTFLRQSTVKIRKPHRCWGCTEGFKVGSLVAITVSVDCGSAMTAYWCEACLKIQIDECQDGDGIGYGELVQAKRSYLREQV